MRFVVKLGGAGLENPKLLHACGKAIAELLTDGERIHLRPARNGC